MAARHGLGWLFNCIGAAAQTGHMVAVAQSPETPRPIREGARHILRAIRQHEQGRERG
jgi:hypothetical protein